MELKEQYKIEDLIEIIKLLRAPGGCPWDREQTHESIKKSMIEEVYEAIDALNAHDDHMFANELGDVLLQVAFHAQLASERGAFDFNDILNEICIKLITRHTHVFGNDKADGTDEALKNWEKNKKKEKNLESYTAVLNDVPHSLPALMRAEKVQKKASSAGFDWPDISGAFDKIHEETRELEAAIKSGDAQSIAEEYGDLLFSVVNAGRFLKLTPEVALADATDKFIRRFARVEALAGEQNRNITDMTLAELDSLWEKSKNNG